MPPRRKIRRPAAKAKKKPPARANSSYSDSYSSRSGSNSDESSSGPGNSDEDDPRDYKRGGYHPVMPYQLYNARYRVLSKLGAGAFSTVWLCADEKEIAPATGPQLVAMKVCKSKKSVSEQALDEVMLLERLHGGGGSEHVVKMTDHFWHTGPNGRHKCMTFEVMGENLLALVKHYDYNGLPLPLCRRLSRHTLLGLEFIHARGVIHTDVKLENVLIQRHDLAELAREADQAHLAFMEQKSGLEQLSKSQKKRMKKKSKAQTKDGAADQAEDAESDKEAPADKPSAPAAKGKGEGQADGDSQAVAACGRPVPPVRQRERFDTLRHSETFAKLADFGNGIVANKPVTDDIQTRQYRSPEVIIGADWDSSADVWSAACMFFELATGDFLFDPRTGDDWDREEDHLALIAELLGGLPCKEYCLSGKYSKDFFLNSGQLKHIKNKNLKLWPLKDVLMEKYSFPEPDAEEMADFLLPMLTWEPRNRQAASEALKHRWLEPRESEEEKEPPRKPPQEDEQLEEAVEELSQRAEKISLDDAAAQGSSCGEGEAASPEKASASTGASDSTAATASTSATESPDSGAAVDSPSPDTGSTPVADRGSAASPSPETGSAPSPLAAAGESTEDAAGSAVVAETKSEETPAATGSSAGSGACPASAGYPASVPTATGKGKGTGSSAAKGASSASAAGAPPLAPQPRQAESTATAASLTSTVQEEAAAALAPLAAAPAAAQPDAAGKSSPEATTDAGGQEDEEEQEDDQEEGKSAKKKKKKKKGGKK
eukprot:TRINITY_DN2529_c0_g1_i2.p1 TRINITY_DN2529_c0_g1~~TRINITY_DN2529_c0_g1_i2.p1  ORF type:complete len:782 (+),score=185.89 TRINITY_DN2529_c0_g1_i2:28-2346(+)